MSAARLDQARSLVIVGVAIVVSVGAALLNIADHLPLLSISILTVLGAALAFVYETWVLALLLLIVIPTTDAQLAQTPLLVSGTNFAVSYVDPLLALIFGAWFLALVVRRRHLYRGPLNAPYLLFLVTVVLAAVIGLITGARPGDVWIALRPPLMYFLAFVAASSFASSRQVARFIGMMMLIILSVAAWGIYVSVTGQGTAISTAYGFVALRNFQGAQSAYLVIGLLCVLGIVMFVKRRWVCVTLALTASVLGGAVLVSFIRGNWVGVFVGIAAVALLLPGRLRVRFVIAASAVILATLLLVSSVILLSPERSPLLDVARERLFSIFDPSASTQYTTDAAESRVFEWNSGLPQILESPIIGHGYGHYFTIEFVRGELTLVRGFHNSYLTIAYTNGLIGLLAFVWLSGAFLIYAWRLSRKMPISIERGIVTGLAAAYLSILVASVVNFYLFDIVNVPPFMGMAIGIVLYLGRQHTIQSKLQSIPGVI